MSKKSEKNPDNEPVEEGPESVNNEPTEERYEALEMIIKARDDDSSWFDILTDMITEQCEGSEDTPCTCGLESAGGCSGTLDECYRWSGIADDIVERVNKADLLLVLDYLLLTQYHNDDAVYEAADRLRKECTWWEDTKASFAKDEDELEE